MDETASTQQPLTKKERRALRRQEKETGQLAENRSNKIKKAVTRVSVGLIIAGVIVGLGTYFRQRERDLPGQLISEMGSRAHIASDSAHEPYNSNPPTSGPHYSAPTKAGVYSEQAADEILVHNMEHGHVIIWYKCSEQKPFDQGCKDEREKMRKMVEEEFDERKVVLMPRVELDTRFALTAWERLDKFNDFDEERVRRFIKAYRNRGPEATAE